MTTSTSAGGLTVATDQLSVFHSPPTNLSHSAESLPLCSHSELLVTPTALLLNPPLQTHPPLPAFRQWPVRSSPSPTGCVILGKSSPPQHTSPLGPLRRSPTALPVLLACHYSLLLPSPLVHVLASHTVGDSTFVKIVSQL